jgi:hypothetical protein
MDRSRLEQYLGAIKAISDADPKALKEHSILLARTLGIRLEQQCFDKPLDEQSACLTRNPDNLVLGDGHSQSMVTALANGPSSDLAGAVSATSIAGGGFYSAYVGAVVDLARLLGNLHTASYMYIPALALPKRQELNLKLNNPPSFRKPMSVIVVGLPAIEATQLPPLRAVKAAAPSCLQNSALVLPVEGAPLVFSSNIAHDFFLEIPNPDGPAIKLPARADASRGGLVIDTNAVEGTKLEAQVTGTLHGVWGFEPYEGPSFVLATSRPTQWVLSGSEQSALIVGRDDSFHLGAQSAACVDDVKVRDAQGKEIKTSWSSTKPGELELKVGLKDQPAGPVMVRLRQYGLAQPDEFTLRTYAEAAHLDSFRVRFAAGKLTRANEKDELELSAAPPDSAKFQPDQSLVAHVTLKDGRTIELAIKVGAPRPRVTLVSKNIQLGDSSSTVNLGSQDELPQDGQMSFLLKTEIPEKFPRSERIEVATADESFSVLLSVADGTLVLRDSETFLAMVDPHKALGPSAFGQLQFRPVQADGRKGDWQPLATLVRVPVL